MARSDSDMAYDPLVDDGDAALRAFHFPWEHAASISLAHEQVLKPPSGGGGGGGSGGGGTVYHPPSDALSGSAHAGPSFTSVGQLNGSYMIPPDAASAVGSDSVVLAVNGEFQVWSRGTTATAMTKALDIKLDSLFAGVSSGGTFDPRVLYDPNSGRFIVVAVDQNATAGASHILVAVSNDGKPTGVGSFHVQSIDATLAAPGSWADFPQLGLDGQGDLYITANMFGFASGQFTGSRVWIASETNPSAAVSYDPAALLKVGANALFSLAPSHASLPTAASGDYLVAYNSAVSGGQNLLEIVHVDSAGNFTLTPLTVGLIDQNSPFGGLSASQPGTTKTIDADDSRTAAVVWQNGHLYVATDILPVAGKPDAGHTTAHWWAISADASGAVGALLTQGDVSGDAFRHLSGLSSYYPSLAVGTGSAGEELAVGFSGSGATNGSNYTGYPSAYEVTINPFASSAAYQEAGAWQVLQAGVDNYYRTFGSGNNRWGDYSSISTDPRDGGSYWAFNEYAQAHGTSFMGENGQWGTELGLFG